LVLFFFRVGTDSNMIEDASDTPADAISAGSNNDVNNVEGNYGSTDVCK
jgi:hypothetical protein